jgi:hypothetical protein
LVVSIFPVALFSSNREKVVENGVWMASDISPNIGSNHVNSSTKM